ncbi:hypothetical protein ACFVW2_27570 [Streptomyces sp. NPDC058171]
MTKWIERGVMAWIEDRYLDDESVLVFFKGTRLAAMTEGLVAQHRPPLAHGDDAEPGGWGAVVHHLYDPERNDFDPIDHRRLCPEGAELMVFIPHPCLAKGHGPKAYHYEDGRISSCIDYEDPDHVGEYWPNEMASLIAAAGLGNEHEDERDREYDDHDERLTRLICDHLGLPALHREAFTVTAS